MNNLNETIEKQRAEIQRLTQLLEESTAHFKNELEACHEYYEGIIALMPGHVYWLDRNNVFLGCNNLQAENAGLKSRKEIIGKTNYDLPWKDQAEELNKINNLVMETGTPHTVEEYAVMANGTEIYLSEKVPLRNKNNEIIGVLGISMDITQRKKMEVSLNKAIENAEVANQVKTEFIANMSHDINTPISGIVGMSKLLEDSAQNPEQKQYARWIKGSGEQLLELLEGVIEVVAADSNRENDVHLDIFDLLKNIQDIAYLVQPTVRMKQIQLRLEIDKEVPRRVITDGKKLHKVLLNLIGNAIKFTENGSVTMKVNVLANESDYVQLQFSIIDTGIGIPSELQTMIFDRFYRVSPSFQNKKGGYGVGLHIAQKYIGLLGGEILLESELGKGSNFSFVLSMKVEQEHDLVTNQSGNAPLILLVEDNIVSLRLLETVVEQAGYPFYSAVDSEHALELLETNEFDFVITDMDLSGASGKTLIQSIRDWENKMHKALFIVGLSIGDSQDLDKKCLQSGVDKMLAKPIHLNALRNVVDELVSSRKNI